MAIQLNEQATKLLAAADRQARNLNHAYIGTEHILLALLLDESCDETGTIAALSLDPDAVRAEINKLTFPGAQSTLPNTLPYTTRAKHVLQMAGDEAAFFNQTQIEPDHLLIALTRETDGVASRVLCNLGLDLHQIRAQALKIRLMQIRLIERIVRPLHAGAAHKRQIREELLTHLTSIYQEELEKNRNPLAAMNAAAIRFGDPPELSRELQKAIPRAARRAYAIEYWLGWRPPESVVRMLARVSLISIAFMLLICGIGVLAEFLFIDGQFGQPGSLRYVLALGLTTAVAQFLCGLCYFKTRDSLWGAFGSRRSRLNALAWSTLGGLSVFTTSIGFIAVAEGNTLLALKSLPSLAALSIFAFILFPFLARFRGGNEIRDTIWSTIDLQTAD